MTRDETERYKQDNLGNSRRELDEFRAREGSVGGESDDGLLDIGSEDTQSDQVIYSLPTHADEAHLIQLTAHNRDATDGNTFHLLERQYDNDGNLEATVQRSVPQSVGTGETFRGDYVGKSFEDVIVVNSDFAGTISLGLIVDHHEESEPESEQNETP